MTRLHFALAQDALKVLSIDTELMTFRYRREDSKADKRACHAHAMIKSIQEIHSQISKGNVAFMIS